MSNNIPNLDSLCARYGYDVVQKAASKNNLSKSDRARLENTITKSLGVLQENGVYAFFLYLKYRQDEKGAKEVKEQSIELLRHGEVELLPQNNKHFEAVRKLTESLDNLLLARQLLEQMLIYARYHAKALRVTE